MRRIVILVAVSVLAACQERGPTSPNLPFAPQASLVQNTGFYFISPTPPGNPVGTGVFNPSLAPVVEICRLSASDVCDGTYYAWFGVDGSPFGEALSVDLANEQYAVSWTGLNALKAQPVGRRYRIHVSSSFMAGDHFRFGSADVELTDGDGGGLNVSGNVLPIKFRIEEGAICGDTGCLEFTVSNATGGQFILEKLGDDDIGSFGLQFDAGFCATGDCDDRITVVVERYRGPERCIPVDFDAIQYEACVRVYTIPEQIAFNALTVYAGICVDPRAASLENANLLRVLKVKETSAGAAIPGTVEDINATREAFFFDCAEVFWTPDELGGSAWTDSGLWSRFAALTNGVLAPALRLIAPRPVHAKRRFRGPYVATLEDFSRLGSVVAVEAQFDRDFATGDPNSVLPGAEQPRVRVIGVRHPLPTTSFGPGTPAWLPVPHVQVRFTAHAGTVSPIMDETDAQGYVSAQWTLGGTAENPQRLTAEVGAPTPRAGVTGSFPNGEDEPGAYWWASHTFTAFAQEFDVSFLSPLSNGSASAANVTDVTTWVTICGPLAPGSATTPGQPCSAPAQQIVLPASRLKNGFWETAWKTNKGTEIDRLYRLDVWANGFSTGTFLMRLGGGGGSDPEGTLQVQASSNIPVKYVLIR